MQHFSTSKLGKRFKKPGLAPGTLVYTGVDRTEPSKLSIFSYSESHLDEIPDANETDLENALSSSAFCWVNVSGIHDIPMIEMIGQKMRLHALVLEDIVHPEQRAKLEVYDDHLYVVSKMIYQNAAGALDKEQISIILGKNFVISFQERPEDVFEPVRERLRTGKGLMRKMGSDYLAYALLDLVVDHYFLVLEDIGSQMERFEEDVMDHPSKQTMSLIRAKKRN